MDVATQKTVDVNKPTLYLQKKKKELTVQEIFDVFTIGCGSAGLMAACTAAAKKLKVCLIEEKVDITQVMRACWSHFIMDDGHENETIAVECGKLRFQLSALSFP